MAETTSRAVVPADTDTDGESELAPVHYLHPEALGGGAGEPTDGAVLDAEVISEEEYQRLVSQRGQALERYRGYAEDAQRAYHYAAPRTKTASVFIARHGFYLTAGTWEVVCDCYAHVSGRDIDAEIHRAQDDHDHATAAALLAKKQEQARVRLEYVKTLGKGALWAPVAAAGAAATVAAVTLIASVVAWARPGGATFTGVWDGLVDAVLAGWEWLTWAGGMLPWAGVVALAGVVATGYNRRRTRGDAPQWAAPQRTDAGADEVAVTADRLIQALRYCGIPELKKAIQDGETTGMVDLISQFGPGVRTTITLPRGIPASTLVEKASSLASSLSRGEHEVMLSRSPNNNSRAELWVARPGALDEPVPASPMLDEDYGPVDLYADPVPWGLSPQGEPIELDLIQRHILIAGLSKQGKTAAARALALHAAFDPSVEFRIADLKGVGDWSMFDGLAATLIEGPGEENELATADMVERATAEMDRRIAARRTKGAKGDITSKEAKDRSGDNHPLIVIVDEVQIAYMSQAAEMDYDSEGNPKKGKRVVGGQSNNSRLWQAAKKLHDQGRAVNVHLWQFAQNPTDRNLPTIVREGAHVRGSLHVSAPSISRKAVGGPAVDAGAAPHRLRNEIDAGTVVTVGAPEIVQVKGDMANTARTHFIDTDPAHQVAERAKQIRAAARQATSDGDVAEERDVLADVVRVLGGEDYVTAKTVVVRLGELAPRYYDGWTGKGLHAFLKTHCGFDPGGKNGTPVVRLERAQDALSDRVDDE